MSEKSYPRGHRDGLKWAITWLHRRANEMNDPHAKAILNTAAFNMGVEAKQEPFLHSADGPVVSPSPSDIVELLRTPTGALPPSKWELAAADEIERLRLALQAVAAAL